MTSRAKPDERIAESVEQARSAAHDTAADFGVGDYLGCQAEGERVATHYFECTHPGYQGWRWAVSMTRAPRARSATVDEVTLVPGVGSLIAPIWVPWSERLQPGDVAPGMLLPTPDNDPRLEQGFSGTDMAPDEDPAEWSQTRAVVAELGLGRERVLSADGRADAARRWSAGPGGPHDQSTKLAPGHCVTCGYFVRLGGQLGVQFGVCANEYSPADGRVVTVEHGCGGHSDVVSDHRGAELPAPVFDTISLDHPIFD